MTPYYYIECSKKEKVDVNTKTTPYLIPPLSDNIAIWALQNVQKFKKMGQEGDSMFKLFKFASLKVRDISRPVILIQGGMGAGISLARLAGAVARLGGIGIVSTVGLKAIMEKKLGRPVSHSEAVEIVVKEAIRLSGGHGMIGVNCMALMESCDESVRAAVRAGAKVIIVGAGLHLHLPELVGDADVAIIPIVSSVRALELLCRKWARMGRMPDAVIVEGPRAGGHLGFKEEDIERPEFQLESIFPPILEFARQNGNFPVIVAGGIWDRADIIRWMKLGAAGVQIGTRFLATHESGASKWFKKAVVAARACDIAVVMDPGSPSGLPFRIIVTSDGYRDALKRIATTVCRWGYMLRGGTCLALHNAGKFCICYGLLSAIGVIKDPKHRSIYTVGVNASRVTRITSVKWLMYKLTGHSKP